jgi:hypothetical protein
VFTRPLTDLPAALALFEEVQAAASARDIALRAQPPVPTTCCGRGCNGCVWEGFYAAAAYWRDEAALLLAE